MASSSIGPQFFKVILEGIANEHKLMIPPEFIRIYGKHLPKHALLKVRTGAVWGVELVVDSKGHVWLQNGWQQFKEYYSIGLGHFVVFRFDGPSHFHVMIFDTTATEIQYPVGSSHNVSQNNKKRHKLFEKDVIDDDSFENLDDSTKCYTRGKKKKGVVSPSGMKLETKKCSRDAVTTTRHLRTEAPKRMQLDEKYRALERAKDYKSEDPFVVIYMQPSYVEKSSLNFPVKFARKYFGDKRNITLVGWDGRTRSVKISFGASYAKLSWGLFAKDHHLKVGDVCVFQLIKGLETSLKVIIF